MFAMQCKPKAPESSWLARFRANSPGLFAIGQQNIPIQNTREITHILLSDEWDVTLIFGIGIERRNHFHVSTKNSGHYTIYREEKVFVTHFLFC